MLLVLTENWDLMKDSHEHDEDSFEVYKKQRMLQILPHIVFM